MKNTTGTGDELGLYKSLYEDESGNLNSALLIVNWHDYNNVTAEAKIDLSAAGFALSRFDKCEIMDLWTEETVNTNGGEHSFQTKDMMLHHHLAFRINCNAF